MVGVQTGKEKEKACGRKRKTAGNHQNYRNYFFCFAEGRGGKGGMV